MSALVQTSRLQGSFGRGYTGLASQEVGLKSPWISGCRTRQTLRHFYARAIYGRGCDGYNTRKGKKSAWLIPGFEPPATSNGCAQNAPFEVFARLDQERFMSQSVLGFSPTPAVSGTPSTFSFGDHAVRIVMRDGEPWFVAADVMGALEYSVGYKPSNACSHVPEEWKGVQRMDTLGGDQKVLCLAEHGLYFFLGRSDKPKAIPFQKRTAEILTELRKTGGYGQPNSERVELAHRLATHATAQVWQTVFDAVMAGDSQDWMHSRYALGLTYGHGNKPNVPWAKALPPKVIMNTWEQLIEGVAAPDGLYLKDAQLAHMATACNQKLAQRLGKGLQA